MAYDAFKSYFCDLLQTTKPSFYPGYMGFVIKPATQLGWPRGSYSSVSRELQSAPGKHL